MPPEYLYTHMTINHPSCCMSDQKRHFRYWIGRNSWGTYWGEDGLFRISMHHNNLGVMDSCSWATPTVEEEVEPPTSEDGPLQTQGTFTLDTSVEQGTYHSYHHGCLQRSEGRFTQFALAQQDCICLGVAYTCIALQLQQVQCF